MSDHHSADKDSIQIKIDTPGYLSFSRKAILGMASTAILGGLAAFGAASLYTDGMTRIALAYLVAVSFVLSLSLGSLFFVLIQHLTRAGWAVLIRRPAEVFSLNIITVAVLSLPIVWSSFNSTGSIYPWARTQTSDQSSESHGAAPQQDDHVRRSHLVGHYDSHHDDHHDAHHDAHDPREHLYVHQTFDSLTASKTGWLNSAFFTGRMIFYFSVWTILAGFYFYRSRRQDEAGGVTDTLAMERWAGPGILLFGITLTFASFDLLMSLDPHWYSTIFGVYYFAGCAVGGFSVCLLSWLVLSRLGIMPARLSDSHYRDLGRLLFAFVFFWAYIAFSQYMLLWYANVPETTRWWAIRGASLADGYRSSWGVVLIILLLGHFVIPFLAIMSRHVKGNQKAMIFWTIWMLAMHYLDLYWLVMPEFRPYITFGLPELGTLLLVGSLYAIGASFFATQTALVPVGDPRLKDSVALSDAY